MTVREWIVVICALIVFSGVGTWFHARRRRLKREAEYRALNFAETRTYLSGLIKRDVQ